MLQKAAKDPIFFINEFLWTFNPKQEPYHFEFKLYPFQYDFVYELVEAIETGNDLFIEKCREMGATYVTLAVFFWFWRFVPGSNFLVGSRKEDFVDNTKGDAGELSNKEESLFGKLEYFLNHLDPIALPDGFNIKKHMTYMSLLNPENGNSISGESSNPNFSRGGRQKAILLDEFAFWENDTAAWGSTADTTDCRVVLTTPGIKPSKAKRLRFGQDGEKIKVLTFGHELDPRKTAKWLERERTRRSEEDFAREIMINWEGSITGIVYPEVRFFEVGLFPYDPAWSLYMAWDFGLDGTALGAWQLNPMNGKLRLVDSYFNDNKPIQFFFPLIGKDIDSTFQYNAEDLDAIAQFRVFKKAIHYGDPDVEKRAYQVSSMQSTRSELAGIGVHVQTNPGSNKFHIRREQTKVWMQKGVEINDTPRNQYFVEAIRNARYPQRTENSQTTSEVNKPIHDWTSHPRTMMEYLCVNIDKPERFTPPPQTAQQRILRQLEDPSGTDLVDDVLGDFF